MTTQDKGSKRGKQSATRKGISRLLKFGLPLLCLAGVVYYFTGDKEGALTSGTTYKVTRGALEITVLEGGSIEAAESLEIKSEVQGSTKILTIVEEGYLITPEDVANGLVLVELDSKELIDRELQEELSYQNATASFTEAKEEYGIQVNQNESDLKAAELAVTFARMDLEKYLGTQAAADILQRVEEIMQEDLPVLSTGGEPESVVEAQAEAETEATAEPLSGAVLMESTHRASLEFDYSTLAHVDKLGDGEARQQLRKLEDDLVLSDEEVGLASSRLEGTRKLHDKDFVTKIELENDELSLKRKAIARDAAETASSLFIKYEFPKKAQTLVSDFEEALRKMERARRLAVSKLAQAEAKLNSAEARYNLQSRQLEEIREQIEKCVIRATKPGLAVYGGEESYYRSSDRIEEGASVRERQIIFTIPDTTRMSVNVKVHESYVKRVQLGQRARIRVDAFPDVVLEGNVTKIAVLPDSQNRWMNPDLKVYATKVILDEEHDWLKPGLSAEVEILIDRLEDVLQVPLQTVSTENGEQVVYVSRLGGPERRVVKTGAFNDTFIEIQDGVEEGERLLLLVPEVPEDSEQQKPEEGERPGRGEREGGKAGARPTALLRNSFNGHAV